jgi:DNA replication protein DnaC
VLPGDSGTGTTHLLIGLGAHILETQMSNGEIDLAVFTKFRSLSGRTKTVAYWTATGLVVAELGLRGSGTFCGFRRSARV